MSRDGDSGNFFFSFTFDVFINLSVVLANFMAQDCVKTVSVSWLQILCSKFSVSLLNRLTSNHVELFACKLSMICPLYSLNFYAIDIHGK